MKALIEKLVHVQSELKAPKTQENTFGKYKYRKAEDILEAVKPLLKSQGLYLSITDDIILVGDRFYVKSTASIEDGEFTKSVSALAREEADKKGMDGSQITGASSSYARKYALNGLFGIDDTTDSDGTNEGHKEPEKKSATPPAAPPPPKTTASKSSTPVPLIPTLPIWGKVIDGLKTKGKKKSEWPEIKKSYVISEAHESQLFSEMKWA